MPQYSKEIKDKGEKDEIKKNGSDLWVRVSGSNLKLVRYACKSCHHCNFIFHVNMHEFYRLQSYVPS